MYIVMGMGSGSGPGPGFIAGVVQGRRVLCEKGGGPKSGGEHKAQAWPGVGPLQKHFCTCGGILYLCALLELNRGNRKGNP